jgi:hypothetical protein
MHNGTDLDSDAAWWGSIAEAGDSLYRKPDVGFISADVELVVNGPRIRAAMVDLLMLSFAISLVTALFVYLAVHVLLVRPMRRVVTTLAAIRDQPRDLSQTIAALGPVCEDIRDPV